MSEGGSIARQRRLEPGDLVHVQADDFDLWRDDTVIRGKAPEELSHDDIGCFTAAQYTGNGHAEDSANGCAAQLRTVAVLEVGGYDSGDPFRLGHNVVSAAGLCKTADGGLWPSEGGNLMVNHGTAVHVILVVR
jgi:hypothetical protein